MAQGKGSAFFHFRLHFGYALHLLCSKAFDCSYFTLIERLRPFLFLDGAIYTVLDDKFARFISLFWWDDKRFINLDRLAYLANQSVGLFRSASTL